MLELRPHLRDADTFVARVDDVQRPEGYRLVASFDDGEDDEAAGVAGFRVPHHLAWGHALYVDDLSTRAASRGRGHAGALLDWLLAEAQRLGCDQFHLDSGVLPERTDAHRLYLNKRLQVTSLHFARVL
jgi:GNAT superfamily N-acetyltransferase